MNAKLQWHKHQRIVLQKVQRVLSSLSRTSYSTWGLPVPTSRLVYIATLRSLLSYTMGVWFNSLRKPANISSLITFQSKCLRLIEGVFKATSVFLLESKLFLLPLHLYFKFHTACFLSSIQNFCEANGVTIVVRIVWLQEERELSLCRPVAGTIGSAVGLKR